MSSSGGLRARRWCYTVDDRCISVVEPPCTTKTLGCGQDGYEPSKAMRAASQQRPNVQTHARRRVPVAVRTHPRTRPGR